MKPLMIAATGATLLSLSSIPPFIAAVQAKDHSVMGQTWPVAEPDFLDTIDQRLKVLQASGGLERMHKELARKAEHRVRNPEPVAGIAAAAKPREWLFDPSIVLERDLTDHKGSVIAAAGSRVNPLGLVDLTTQLVFIDGRDPAQLQWAMGKWSAANAKIIFVAGSPFERMGEYQRRFFFDQGGQLTAKFGITAVPAVVSQEGKELRVRELPLPSKETS